MFHAARAQSVDGGWRETGCDARLGDALFEITEERQKSKTWAWKPEIVHWLLLGSHSGSKCSKHQALVLFEGNRRWAKIRADYV